MNVIMIEDQSLDFTPNLPTTPVLVSQCWCHNDVIDLKPFYAHVNAFYLNRFKKGLKQFQNRFKVGHVKGGIQAQAQTRTHAHAHTLTDTQAQT